MAKSGNASGKSKQQQRRSGDAEKAIDALLGAIQGNQVAKAGMTKAQLKAFNEKLLGEASQQLPGGANAAATPSQAALEEAQSKLQANFQEAQRRQRDMYLAAIYVNVPQKLQSTAWTKAADGKYVRYSQFDNSQEQIAFLTGLFARELTEPYSMFTHIYFIQGWPDLAIVAFGYEGDAMPDASVVGTMIGGIVSKVARKGPGHPLRAYVAMLAVEPKFRGARIGSQLVVESVGLMKAKGCDYVYLETPTGNLKAMKLYTDLGFAKCKLLHRYYMDGSDAIRLKLWLRSPFAFDEEDQEEGAAAEAMEALPVKA
jgi:peptide alpha-N-acetyltransferase